MDNDYLIDKILEIGEKNGFEVDIFLSKSESTSADLDGDSLDSIEENKDFGIGVRVLKDNKIGFAYSSDENEKVIYKAMENLVLDKYTDFPELAKNYPNPSGIFYKDILNMDEQELISDLITMEDILKESDITITGGGIGKSYEYNRIVNSKGLDIGEEFTYYSASISGIKDGETAYDYLTKTHRFNVEEMANKVKELLTLPQGIKTEYKGNIVLNTKALNSLLGYTLIPSFNAENVQRKRSVLTGKIGEKIFGDNINIIDDGTLNNALYSAKVDGEGTPTKRTILVEDGVLKNYLYDIKRANIEEGKESTGNGMRGYSSLPSVSASNFIIEPVEKIDDFDEYLCINNLIGAHTSNPITGDFSVEIRNSYIVKNGEKIPVKKGMLSGNIFEIFKDAIPLDNVEQRGKLISPPLLINGKIIV
ncbi:TldD/PmbA family protein [Methanothermococcus okinawensis]|uniref:Peptidase U62 modulator of DNA gyrase n=1 Tax=Methanothermococcus okinawensis (strain DSM 14208 / JCM 11175 / IH1) TaxID=647113 RepID=F8AJL4_METOI|nr:TldD/PmbA family protein [Methanothermococcus okinawensis]AEH07200.1 peptidase U62 modulator of DNA gyrase [Methanothermococcus okinawensis IH1]